MSDTKPDAKPTSKKAGTVLDVKDGAKVTRPDESTETVSGTQYVLDTAGTFVVDGDEYAVKG